MGLEPPPPLICKKTMTTDQQPIKTNIYFTHFSDNFFSHFPISKSKFWRVMGRNGHKPTLFPFFHKPFFHFSHPHIYIAGILGKNGVGPPHFILHYSHPQIQISTRFGKKWSWSSAGQISICDSLCVWAQHTPMGYDIRIISINISITISIIYVA